jgi:hypothetical protein
MRSAPEYFVTTHKQSLRRFVLDSEATRNLIRDLPRLLHNNDPHRAIHLGHLPVNAGTNSAGIAVLENDRRTLAGFGNESLQRLDILNFDKPFARHVSLS